MEVKSLYSETSELPPLMGALLRRPWEAVRARMIDGLHERGHTDLVAAHLTVFQYPGPEGARPSELAASKRMTKQAINYLLGQLEALGYLERRAGASGARSRRVHLTERGHAVMAALREIVQEVERDWEARLGSEEFARLRELLAELNRIVATDD